MLQPNEMSIRKREVIIKPTHRGLETLRELAGTANARIYIGFDKHFNGEKE